MLINLADSATPEKYIPMLVSSEPIHSHQFATTVAAAATAASRHPNLISGVHHRSRRWLEKSRHVEQHACGFVPAINPSMNPFKSGSSWGPRRFSYFLSILWLHSLLRQKNDKRSFRISLVIVVIARRGEYIRVGERNVEERHCILSVELCSTIKINIPDLPSSLELS